MKVKDQRKGQHGASSKLKYISDDQPERGEAFKTNKEHAVEDASHERNVASPDTAAPPAGGGPVPPSKSPARTATPQTPTAAWVATGGAGVSKDGAAAVQKKPWPSTRPGPTPAAAGAETLNADAQQKSGAANPDMSPSDQDGERKHGKKGRGRRRSKQSGITGVLGRENSRRRTSHTSPRRTSHSSHHRSSRRRLSGRSPNWSTKSQPSESGSSYNTEELQWMMDANDEIWEDYQFRQDCLLMGIAVLVFLILLITVVLGIALNNILGDNSEVVVVGKRPTTAGEFQANTVQTEAGDIGEVGEDGATTEAYQYYRYNYY